jgi:hypothetical protein
VTFTAGEEQTVEQFLEQFDVTLLEEAKLLEAGNNRALGSSRDPSRDLCFSYTIVAKVMSKIGCFSTSIACFSLQISC